jgi:hypothetical protein
MLNIELLEVRNLLASDNGFRGNGQTVAIIDSGIAYDHVALADNYVGGYDFAEQEQEPYDDGPAGGTGTHMAGIITGLAPDVDIVALRVFDDDGGTSFDRIEAALRWVHDNKDNFANPITTVNLSVASSWNGNAPPDWAMLEEELSQLEQDGIFVAASAGNSFLTGSAPGLSYPAASPHVVPVMSVDDDASVSYFSQRHGRAIAAPGRSVNSTVPDYAGNGDGTNDDWKSYSGTSVSTPQIAAAAVIIREAMSASNVANIDQQAIYTHIRDNADLVFDSETSTNYLLLNLQKCLDDLTAQAPVTPPPVTPPPVTPPPVSPPPVTPPPVSPPPVSPPPVTPPPDSPPPVTPPPDSPPPVTPPPDSPPPVTPPPDSPPPVTPPPDSPPPVTPPPDSPPPVTPPPVTPDSISARLFYNNSVFGEEPDMNKKPISVGETAGPGNISGFQKGINGIVIELPKMPRGGSALSAADFEVRVGTGDDVSTWNAGPMPEVVIERKGRGQGTDRVRLTFPDYSIVDTYVAIKILATSNSGLSSPYTFIFGSSVGDTGANGTLEQSGRDSMDLQAIARHLSQSAEVDNEYDLNKDGRVDALDMQVIAEAGISTSSLPPM